MIIQLLSKLVGVGEIDEITKPVKAPEVPSDDQKKNCDVISFDPNCGTSFASRKHPAGAAAAKK
eukprot:JP448858.1.p1 GENE.JP448858.1~~JP448858.1.p1  ORF type:complete len:73 (+),score=33.44 JP448858.1:29-220(+)